MNYKKITNPNGTINYVYERVGKWESGDLTMNDDRIYWPLHNQGHVPTSTCSDECAKGHVKVNYLHFIIYCFHLSEIRVRIHQPFIRMLFVLFSIFFSIF